MNILSGKKYQGFKQVCIPSSLNTVFFTLGYITLLGPSQAKNFQKQKNTTSNELSRQPLYIILLVETIIRISLFLILMVSIEELIGDTLFEQLRLDQIALLMGCFGLLHIFSYFVAVIILDVQTRLACLIYRLGRNITYALLPAIFSIGIALLIQYKQQIPLYSGNMIVEYFSIVFSLGILIGIIHSILMQTKKCKF